MASFGYAGREGWGDAAQNQTKSNHISRVTPSGRLIFGPRLCFTVHETPTPPQCKRNVHGIHRQLPLGLACLRRRARGSIGALEFSGPEDGPK